jgi:hypothetical protein
MQKGSSFVELKKFKSKVDKVIKRLSVHKAFGHLVKALASMSQDFANKAAVEKVLALFNGLELNLNENRANMDIVNAAEIATFEEFMRICA